MFWGIQHIRKFASKAQSILNLLQSKPINENVTVMGWVKSSRHSGKGVSFYHIDDGSTVRMLQVVVPKSVHSTKFGFHSCLSIEGKIVSSIGQQQDVELLADDVKIISRGSPPDYPYTAKGNYLEEDIRALPHFRVRTRHFSSLLRVRSQAKSSIRKYFDGENFINIDTPLLTTNNCEGGCLPFLVRGHGIVKGYDNKTELQESAFGCPVYLTVSGQLHLEAMVSGLSKVYNFNPAFRGEMGSRLHLHEFWMVEMEEAFLEGKTGYDALMERLEKFVKFTVEDIMSNAVEDIEFLWKFHKQDTLKDMITRLLDTPFVKIKYKDAIDILKEKNPEYHDESKHLNKQSECFLTEYFGNVPVVITHFPATAKPFYMYTAIEDGELIALGMDLLLPDVGEVAGGGLREHRQNILRKYIDPDLDLDWYVDLRKFGHAPSGGFGLGLERFLQFLLGISNISDTIPFPRSNGRCIC